MTAVLLAMAALSWGEPPATESAPAPPPACVCICQSAEAAPRPEALAPPTAASAELAPPADAARKPGNPAGEPTTWYGGPAIAADAAALALMTSGAMADAGGAFWFGMAGFALGAPINHLAHGESGRALGSFGIRALAAGLAVGLPLEDILVNHCDGDVTPCRDAGTTIAIGTTLLVAAMVLDDALLARAPEPSPRKAISLVPGLAIAPGAGFASLSGRF
jgi:hypothetical protein